MTKRITYKSLRKMNLIAAGLHFVQGALILAISKSFAVPVTGSYLAFNKSTQGLDPASTTLFHIQLAWLIAVFFFLSAAAHLFVATVANKWYVRNLKLGINKARWIEYALSASIMMIAIGLLVGIYDASSLFMIFLLVSTMNLMGLMMEAHNQTTKKTNWLSFIIGTRVGLAPWVVVAFYMWLGAHQGSKAPAFVYWIFVSIFAFFSCFAINMILQYKKIGPWRDYLYGERAYIILSLVAKSLLAWQVFAGTLRP
jgi:hypothetical protein